DEDDAPGAADGPEAFTPADSGDCGAQRRVDHHAKDDDRRVADGRESARDEAGQQQCPDRLLYDDTVNDENGTWRYERGQGSACGNDGGSHAAVIAITQHLRDRDAAEHGGRCRAGARYGCETRGGEDGRDGQTAG